MSDLIIPVADAVVDALNAGSFSEKFKARKRYYDAHWYFKEQVPNIRVDVVPSRVGETEVETNGGHYSVTTTVDLILRKPFTREHKAEDGTVTEAAMEDMIRLLGELHSFFMSPDNRILAGNVGHTDPGNAPQIIILYDPVMLPVQYNGLVRVNFQSEGDA